jgi:hypothetical protein
VLPAADASCDQCGLVLFEEDDEPGTQPREVEEIEGPLLDLDEIRELRAATPTQKGSEYKRLLEVAERKGYAKGWAAHQFRKLYGVWPRFPRGFLDTVAPAARPPVSLDVIRRLPELP